VIPRNPLEAVSQAAFYTAWSREKDACLWLRPCIPGEAMLQGEIFPAKYTFIELQENQARGAMSDRGLLICGASAQIAFRVVARPVLRQAPDREPSR
jgi:hypothetical protein